MDSPTRSDEDDETDPTSPSSTVILLLLRVSLSPIYASVEEEKDRDKIIHRCQGHELLPLLFIFIHSIGSAWYPSATKMSTGGGC